MSARATHDVCIPQNHANYIYKSGAASHSLYSRQLGLDLPDLRLRCLEASLERGDPIFQLRTLIALRAATLTTRHVGASCAMWWASGM